MIMVTIRAIQNPNIKPLMRNLWPRRRLIWSIVCTMVSRVSLSFREPQTYHVGNSATEEEE